MAAESGRGVARRRFRGCPGRKEMLRAWAPHPRVAGTTGSLRKHVCLFVFLSKESAL